MQTQLSSEDLDLRSNLDLFLKDFFKLQDINLKKLWQDLYKKGFIKADNSFLKNVLITEMVCKYEPGIGLFLLTHFANIEIIKSFGSEFIKKQYLDKSMSGEIITCFSLTELSAGSDVSKIETTAKKEGSKWVLNGHKIWASNAEISDVILLFAQTKENGDKSGITCFLVDRSKVSTDEIEILTSTPKLGVKITPSNEIKIKNLKIDDSSLIGDIGDGINIALSTITNGRIFCSAQAVGLLSGVLDQCVKHSVKRSQFGKAISDFQAIQWYLADMSKDLSACRLLLYKSAWAKDNNSSEVNKLSSMTKYFSTSSAQKHSGNAVQIFGGQGLLEDSYVAKAYRDAKVLEIYEGTNEIQKLVIAKELSLKS